MYYQALVNKKHKIKEEMFQDCVLITTKNVDDEDVEIEQKTYDAYCKLKKVLDEKENIKIGILSGYRSIEEQQKVYDEIERKYGTSYAEAIVAPVGKSEHHTGLCIDLSIEKDGAFLIDNNELMKEKETYKKIVPYLSQFGFILRYPEGKEEITKYPYEPWHIRYLGESLAQKLYQEEKTLEEYYENLTGVLVIDKEKDMTSRDVVNIVSRYFYTKKVGHTGTLDPLATGILVITIGKATKISELLTASYKEYIATVKLGLETDTLDITGKVLKEESVKENLEIAKVLKEFPRNYLQEVPIYSAVKVKGKKLYEYARKKEEVILPKKEVTIKELELLEETSTTFTFRTVVSKGTYIRSLIRDIAENLKTPATMLELRRVKQGNFSLENSYTLDELKSGQATLLSLEQSLSNYQSIIVDKKTEIKVKNGQKLVRGQKKDGIYLILNEEKKLLAIYKTEKEELVAWKVLTTSHC